MQARVLLILLLSSVSASGAPRLPPVDHSIWDGLLSEFVDQQHQVDYAGLKKNGRERLDAYLATLAPAAPEPLPAGDAKALLLNAYNAFTVRWIVENYPAPSIWATPNPFKEPRHLLAGERVSLDQIEARLKGTGDPRIHAALVCAARSCPPLRREAYVRERLDEQLDDNTRQWLADPNLNQLQVEHGQAALSPIFKWYREDFEAYPGGLQAFLARYLPPAERQALRDTPLRIRYLDYDWGLNDQSQLGQNYSWFQLGIDWIKNWFR